MDSSSAICEFTYDNMFEHIEKMIRLELLINNPSEEAKSLVKLMSKLVRSELVMDIVKTASNPVSAANLLQIGCGDMSECYDENVIDKLVNFFNGSDEAAQL
ncbi:hypothetical protein TTRE_0000396001 [Trichuris trichiura]|uniref:Uncharacterized protein n=1 Tax=Trichuris trichiura TaxID=36087 RepID=A0A077Z5H4_TRITR|nr:hypothetical protein TTRE_0000396001 [Trichuris trichiura]